MKFLKRNSEWLLVLAIIAVGILAPVAFGYNNSGFKVNKTASVVVDSVYGGNWDPIDSIVGVFADSCRYQVSVRGIVELTAIEPVCYIGFGNDSANRVDSAHSATTGQTNTNIDTFLVGFPEGFPSGMHRIYLPFGPFTYTCSTAVALTDTFYLNAAVRNKGGKATIRDLQLEVMQLH